MSVARLMAARAIFTDANAARTARAWQQDAVRLRAALDAAGDGCPDHYRRVAEARIANPGVPWSQLAGQLGMTKDQAMGIARRLLRTVGT